VLDQAVLRWDSVGLEGKLDYALSGLGPLATVVGLADPELGQCLEDVRAANAAMVGAARGKRPSLGERLAWTSPYSEAAYAAIHDMRDILIDTGRQLTEKLGANASEIGPSRGQPLDALIAAQEIYQLADRAASDFSGAFTDRGRLKALENGCRQIANRVASIWPEIGGELRRSIQSASRESSANRRAACDDLQAEIGRVLGEVYRKLPEGMPPFLAPRFVR
jgi:hypothetical protein